MLLAAAVALVADKLATELADDMALDADIVADIMDDNEEADMAADPVAEDVLLAVLVLLAQTAAVGRFVTPAGTQMLSAYLIVAVCLLSAFYLCHTQIPPPTRTTTLNCRGPRWHNSPFRSAWSHFSATQHVIALMKPASEQMHLGSKLQELGIALRVQFCLRGEMNVSPCFSHPNGLDETHRAYG